MKKTMPTFVRQKVENKATTNAYASILKAHITELSKCSIVIRNAHASFVADWKILVSNDAIGDSANYAEEKAEAQLAGGNATAKYALGNPYTIVDVQAKSNAAGNAALLYIYLYAVGGG